MKTHITLKWLFMCSLIMLSFTSYSQDPNFHIYLLFGQSNMEGTGTIEAQDQVTNSRVKLLQDQTCSNLGRTYGQWYTAAPPLNRCWSGLGPGDYFGKTMANSTASNITIGLVPAAVGGCDIAFFQKSAPIGRSGTRGGPSADIPTQFSGGYAWLLDLAKRAQTVGVIKGILFHQGETNTGDQNWKYQVQEIVADLRRDLGIGNVPFLAGELLYAEYGSCCSSHNVEVNKLPGIIPNAYVISASGLPGKDNAHFTSASYRELGRRYAQTMLTAQGVCSPTTITPAVQVNGGTWQSVNTVTVNAGTSVKLGPQPVTGGSWNWTGCGTSGTPREQTIAPTSTCTATATYTNTCGAKSTMAFTINITGTTGCSTAPNGFPYCCSNSDPDGDGWGWENNASCVIKPTTTQLPNGTYTITARHSGKVLDVYNSSMVDGGNVDQWTSVAGAANQKWIVESLGSGTYSIKALHSGKSLDVSGNSLVDGGDINQWTYNASANQKWKIESVGSGYYRIVSVSSGKCVDVVGNSTTDGASINQYTCSGANNQSFTFQSTTARLASEEQEVEQVTTGIYPNPSNGLFNVSYAGSFSYIIKNSIGAEIEKGVGNGKAIVGKNISTPGIYILQITSSKGSEKKRLVKN
jgi:hypothetical protein